MVTLYTTTSKFKNSIKQPIVASGNDEMASVTMQRAAKSCKKVYEREQVKQGEGRWLR